MLMGCKKVTVDFTMSPTNPRAGEVVTFTNTSTGGSTWIWRYGDGMVSTARSTTHAYRAPGTYVVTLKADSLDKKIASHTITVRDTVPTFVSNHDTVDIAIFNDITFRAELYNPNNYTPNYKWSIEGVEYQVADSTTGVFKVFFTTTGQARVKMHLEIRGQQWDTTRVYEVKNRQGQALLMLNKNGEYRRQRIFFNLLAKETQERTEAVSNLTYAEGKAMLDAEQDTIQQYNGRVFKLSELQMILPSMVGFKIGRNKVYYRTTDGFYVANLNGEHVEPICGEPVSAVYTDVITGAERVYWATSGAVYFMPLVGQPDNKFDVDKIELMNVETDVVRLALDTTLRY